jgi:succinate dehydrogenase hydrophobic anchor subunit
MDLGDDAVSPPPPEAPFVDESPPPTPPTPADGTDGGGGGGPASADETGPRSWAWHLMQLSSWLLLVLLPIQVFSTWVFHDPGHVGVAWYVDRWHSGAWRLFDGTFVVVALVHGGLGLDRFLGARVGGATSRSVISVVIAVVLATTGLLAVSTIVSFNLT